MQIQIIAAIRVLGEILLSKLKGFLHAGIKITFLRISIGMVYLWFGALKFFENLGPAEELASKTLTTLCLGLIPDSICYVLLAVMETLLGVLLILNMFICKTIKLTSIHLLGTFTPVFIQPDVFFNEFPFAITLVGQYILKNMVIICALVVIYPCSTHEE